MARGCRGGFRPGVSAADYDGDGDPDLATANDFGRKVLEDRADGIYTNWNFSWCGAHCPAGGTAVTVETSGTTPIARYSDHLGREVRMATRGLNGSPVYKDTTYNSLGQATGVSRPYYAGTVAYWT